MLEEYESRHGSLEDIQPAHGKMQRTVLASTGVAIAPYKPAGVVQSPGHSFRSTAKHLLLPSPVKRAKGMKRSASDNKQMLCAQSMRKSRSGDGAGLQVYRKNKEINVEYKKDARTDNFRNVAIRKNTPSKKLVLPVITCSAPRSPRKIIPLKQKLFSPNLL